MPHYEFECSGCGREDSFILPVCMRDEPQTCEACGETLSRVMPSSVGLFAPGMLSCATVPPITDLEEGMHRNHQIHLEKNRDKIESGEIRLTPGKYRDKRFDPDLSKK